MLIDCVLRVYNGNSSELDVSNDQLFTAKNVPINDR